MTKPTIFYDPVLQRRSTAARFRGIITSLEAQVAALQAQTPQTVTVEVPVDRIVERIVEVEVPGPERIVEVEVPGPERIIERVVEVEVDREDIAFNRQYIQILQDHIQDLNQFAIDNRSQRTLADPRRPLHPVFTYISL